MLHYYESMIGLVFLILIIIIGIYAAMVHYQYERNGDIEHLTTDDVINYVRLYGEEHL